MKIELEKLHLGLSGITDNVYAGTLNPSGATWRNKIDVTNMFLDCVIKRFENEKETITCGSHTWEVSVKKIS